MADTWDIQGVTSSQGTPVNVDNSSDWVNYEIDPNKDSTVAALEAKANAEGIMSIINSNQSDWDKQWAMDQMRGRMYQAGEGLLGQAIGEPYLQKHSLMETPAGLGTIWYGQRMGESFDDYLARTVLDDEETPTEITLPGGKIVDGELVLDESPESWADFLNLKSDTKKDKNKVKEIAESIALGVASADDEGMEDARLAFPSGLSALNEITPTSPRNIEVLPETPEGTTDIFDVNTGEWTQVKTEEEEIDELINQLSRPRVKENQLRRELAERNLQAAIRREAVEQPSPLVAGDDLNILERALLKTGEFAQDHPYITAALAPMSLSPTAVDTINVDLNKAIEDLTRKAELSAAIEEETPLGLNIGYPDDLAEYDVPVLEDGRLAGMQEGVYAPPDIVPQVDSAGTVAEEFFPGARMTADQSRARTRELNTLGRELLPHEIEAIKRGDLINPREQIAKEMDAFEQGKVAAQQTIEQTEKIFEGLSQALIDAIQADPALMDQYLASREEILARLATGPSPTPGGFTTKTPYVDQVKTHEDWYPGGQASAVGAGFWGPMALPWNPKYRDYKDAQRVFMGKEPGEKYYSDDWIRAFGWMNPEQINELVGY